MKLLNKMVAGVVLPTLALFLLASPVHSFYHATEVQVDSEVGGNADVEVNDSMGVDASLDTDARADADVDTATNTEDGSDDSDLNLTTEGTVDGSLGFSINRSDIDLSADVDTDTALTVEDVVGTEAGFQAFVRQMMAADAQVEQVEVSDEEVSVSYNQRGKLLGFIPVKILTEATVDAEGNIDVDQSWYRFATSVDSNTEDLEVEIESRVESLVNTQSGDSETEVQLSSTQQILLVTELYEALQAGLSETNVESEMNAETEVDVEGSATTSTETTE